MEPAIDYGRFEVGAGATYWALEPALAGEGRRAYPADAFDWAEPVLSESGAVVGETIAPTAPVIDANGPELRTYNRDGHLANAVDVHAAHRENERLATERGMVSDAFRGRPAATNRPG